MAGEIRYRSHIRLWWGCGHRPAGEESYADRIGYLSGGSPGENNEEAFRQGLREQGYVEGQNLVIE